MPIWLHFMGSLPKLLQAVKRNLERFPEDFMLQLNSEEWTALRSQIVTSNAPRAARGVTLRCLRASEAAARLRSHFATSKGLSP